MQQRARKVWYRCAGSPRQPQHACTANGALSSHRRALQRRPAIACPLPIDGSSPSVPCMHARFAPEQHAAKEASVTLSVVWASQVAPLMGQEPLYVQLQAGLFVLALRGALQALFLTPLWGDPTARTPPRVGVCCSAQVSRCNEESPAPFPQFLRRSRRGPLIKNTGSSPLLASITRPAGTACAKGGVQACWMKGALPPQRGVIEWRELLRECSPPFVLRFGQGAAGVVVGAAIPSASWLFPSTASFHLLASPPGQLHHPTSSHEHRARPPRRYLPRLH